MQPKTDSVRAVLDRACQESVFSGYQLYFEKSGQAVSLFGGKLSHWPHAAPVLEDTFFDIGSVTKVVVTASLFAKAEQRGLIDLESTVAHSVPRFKNSLLGDLRLSQLLSHSSGLIDWFPLYLVFKGSLTDWLLENERSLLVATPGELTRYSDFGICVAGVVLDSIYRGWEQAWHGEVAIPLGLSAKYGPVSGNVAATEFCLWRQRLLQGEVFDENTAALGGKSVHAGLFSSAAGLAPFCREWLHAVKGKSTWLSERVAKKYTARAELVKGSTWGLGWDTKSETGSSAGSSFSRESFGHLGYTGCSVWVDPTQEGFAILLTNRVHPSRVDKRIRLVRPQVHDAIAEIWRNGWKA